MVHMNKPLVIALAMTAICGTMLAVGEKKGVFEGTVDKVDSAAKTVAVKVSDGTVHTFHFVKRTTVHGAQATAAGAEDVFHGVKEGTHVVVHYTAKGTVETADEVDDVGRDGLHVTEGAVTHIDRGAKTIAIKTGDGAETTYHMTTTAAKDAGTDIVAGTEKASKVTVYYTEEGGKKVAHFFKNTF